MCLGSFHQAWGDDFECCTSGLLTGSSRIKDLPTGLSQLEHNIIVCQWGRPWNRIYLPSRKKLLFSFVQGKRENRLMVSSHLLGIWWTQGFTQVYILYELGSLIFFLEIKSLLITEYLLASKWQKQNLSLGLLPTLLPTPGWLQWSSGWHPEATQSRRIVFGGGQTWLQIPALPPN